MSALAHSRIKAGCISTEVNKLSSSFEHIDPEEVGNERRFLMSEVSGRTMLMKMLLKIDPDLKKDSPQTKAIIQKLKDLEHKGYQFEAAQSSFELIVRKELGLYQPFFELEHYKILVRTTLEYGR